MKKRLLGGTSKNSTSPNSTGSTELSISNNSQQYAPTTYNSQTKPPINQPWYGISFSHALKRFFRKYATFSGRASRGEFWWIYLTGFLLTPVLILLFFIPGLQAILSVAIPVFMLLIFIPTLSLSVRRLHDANSSGRLLLLPYTIAGLGIGLWAVIVGKIYAIKAEVAGVGVDNAMFILDNFDTIQENPGAVAEDLANSAVQELTTIGVLFVAGLLLIFLAGIIHLILMARSSKPAGAHYDKK